MAVVQPRSFKHPDAGPRDRELRPRVSGSSRGLDRSAAGMVIPASVDTHCIPALVETVKLDLSREWLQGRPVNLESYLESFPELGTADTVSAELILAEYEVRCRAGESVELAQFEERFPHQAVALRQLIDQQSPKVSGRLHAGSARRDGRHPATQAPLAGPRRQGCDHSAPAIRPVPRPRAVGPGGDGNRLPGS